MGSGHRSGAAREYERAIVVCPQLGEAYVHLANLRGVQGRVEEAFALYKKALQVDPRISAVHLNLGNLFALRGMLDEAISEYRAEIRSSPYDVKAYEALARVLQEKKKLRSSPEEGLNSSSHR